MSKFKIGIISIKNKRGEKKYRLIDHKTRKQQKRKTKTKQKEKKKIQRDEI